MYIYVHIFQLQSQRLYVVCININKTLMIAHLKYKRKNRSSYVTMYIVFLFRWYKYILYLQIGYINIINSNLLYILLFQLLEEIYQNPEFIRECQIFLLNLHIFLQPFKCGEFFSYYKLTILETVWQSKYMKKIIIENKT